MAAELADRLKAGGLAVERLGGTDRPVDWTSPSSIAEAIESIRAQGPIAGLVHAMPLGQGIAEGIDDRWTGRIVAGVKGLFLLAKATAADLDSAAGGGRCVPDRRDGAGRTVRRRRCPRVAFLPGAWRHRRAGQDARPRVAAVRCRAVDLASSEPAGILAERLAAELFVADGWAEVGYDGGRRIRLRTVERPIVPGPSALELEPGDPVIITGGARGITALVAAELARAWRPTLLILGTTPEPDGAEPDETAGLTDEAEIKAVLLARLRRAGRPAGPAEIEVEYQAMRRGREVRENLAILRRRRCSCRVRLRRRPRQGGARRPCSIAGEAHTATPSA